MLPKLIDPDWNKSMTRIAYLSLCPRKNKKSNLLDSATSDIEMATVGEKRKNSRRKTDKEGVSNDAAAEPDGLLSQPAAPKDWRSMLVSGLESSDEPLAALRNAPPRNSFVDYGYYHGIVCFF